MKIIQTKLPGKINGICLFPLILVEDKNDPYLVNHEKIHYEQQKELLLLGWLLLYLLSWFRDGYYNNILEKEAYANALDLRYLEKRKRYNYF